MLLTLDYERALELTLLHKDLRRLWLRTYAAGLRKQFLGTVSKRAPMMLALIHESPATRRAIPSRNAAKVPDQRAARCSLLNSLSDLSRSE